MPNEQLPVDYGFDPSTGQPLSLPVDSEPNPIAAKPYVMASDLVGTQQQEQSLPVGYALNDAGIPFNIKTGKEDLPIIRRPSVLPIAKTPDGYTLAMPKVLDAAGSVMGPLAAGKVPLAAGEALLGSGAVRTAKELAEGNPFTIDAFHGTNQPIIKFNKTKSNLNDESATRSTTSDLGTWFTDTPKIAENYAENAAKNLIPNYTAHKKEYDRLQKEVERTEKIKDWKANEKAIEALENHELGVLQEPPSGQNIMPVKLALKKPLEIDAKGGTMNDVDKTHGDVRQLIIDAKKDGYDGVVFKNLNDNPASHEIGTHYVVFDPANVRSKFAKFDPAKYDKNGLFFSDTRPQVASALVRSLDKQNNAPAFYSGLEKAVETAKPTIATADQWLGYLKNQPGVKSEELATVLKELPSGPITKEALGDIVKANKVELGEVTKGEVPIVTKPNPEEPHILEVYHPDDPTGEVNGMWGEIIKKDGKFNVNIPEVPRKSFESQAEAEAYISKQTNLGSDTKFHTYQLPGGENYKEMLLTLPSKDARDLPRLKNGGLDLNATQEFKSSHWDEPNVLAHIRMNDRNVEGSKTLHLEEIQSDWGQGIRKNGFKGEKEKLQPEFDKIEKKIVDSNDENIMGQPNINDALSMAVDKKLITKDEANLYKRYTDVENGKALPDMPFKKNWHQLAIKKVLHKAATEGYEGISITPGDAQAARYDLSKQIDNITYNAPGSKAATKYGTVLKATDKNGNVVINKAVEPHELSDLIGKKAADKLLKTQPSGDKHILQNADLKVGGEGMRSFYDKIVKDEFNNIGKKYGSKVETRTLDNKQPVHYFKITPEMREKAKGGFPLFSAAPIIVPVNHDPFANSEKKGYTLVPIVGNPFGE